MTDESGNFRIADFPPGRYKLTVWHEFLSKRTKEIEEASGEANDVRFEFEYP